MKEITVEIEHNGQRLFSAYPLSIELPFGVMGDGYTIEEAKQDFLDSLEEMSTMHKERTGEDIRVKVVFVVNLVAMLAHYNKYLTLSGLSQLTGIKKYRLSQYLSCTSIPTAKTETRIKQALQNFAKQMQADFVE